MNDINNHRDVIATEFASFLREQNSAERSHSRQDCACLQPGWLQTFAKRNRREELLTTDGTSGPVLDTKAWQ